MSLIEHTDLQVLAEGSASSWRESIFRSFYSIHKIAAKPSQDLKDLVEDHGQLLCSWIHQEKNANTALDDVLSRQNSGQKQRLSSVRIELCKEQVSIFPPQTGEALYSLNVSSSPSSQPSGGASVPTYN
jgi:hypothetical protein